MRKDLHNHFLAILVCTLLPTALPAQIFVDASNNVGIGTTTIGSKLKVVSASSSLGINAQFLAYNPVSSTVVGIDNFVSTDGTAGRYGIRNQVNAASNNNGNVFGLYNDLTGSAALTYGVYNEMTQPDPASTMIGIRNDLTSGGANAVYGEYTSINSTNSATGVRYGNYITMSGSGVGVRYGVYANVTGSANYAGFFNGNVLVTGLFLNPSDARTKENVRAIPSALGSLRQLQPRSYEYRQDLGMALPAGLQYGFIAQDLAQVFPQLVHEADAPLDTPIGDADPARKSDDPATAAGPADPQSMKVQAINYIGLIPIMTQAIQELEAKVDAQALTITALQAEINRR